ncbi:MAG: late competence development ComFB family protein [Defluviitaleaceae bacterium]|nr:late competence development ComFB family protein [Defluviitaleaceae bacterium]MCL2275109.1 late competence development ComFB family protein [Defluviitaleaceae bacterium]
MDEATLRNYMEDAVSEKLPILVKQMGLCDCERCKYDMMAYVLNKLPPKYVVTNKGSLFAKLDVIQSQLDVTILAYLTQAAEIVKKNPNHN